VFSEEESEITTSRDANKILEFHDREKGMMVFPGYYRRQLKTKVKGILNI
jgi:hypothetical protein